MPKPKPHSTFYIMGAAIVPLLAFVGGVVMGAFRIYDEIATKPYVNDKIAEETAQAKLRETTILDKSIDHSDRNHDDMVSRLKDLSYDVKAGNIKLDMVVDTVKVEQHKKK